MADGVTVRVVREVDLAALFGAELRAFLEDVMTLAHGEVSEPGRSPLDTGRLRDSLAPGGGVTMVDRAATPTFAQVGTNVVYAGPLEEGKHPLNGASMNYRGGPSKGKPTKGWLSSTVQNVKPDIDGLLEDMAKRVEDGWTRG